MAAEYEEWEAFEGQQDRFGYSQAIRAGDTIYVAGTSAGMDVYDDIPDDMAGQMVATYRNIDATLQHFGASLSDVVEQTVYVTDMAAAMQALPVRQEAFQSGHKPVSAMIGIDALADPRLLVEIKVTARVGYRHDT